MTSPLLPTERAILEELLDELDRLFDRESDASGTRARLLAAAAALPESALLGEIEGAAAALAEVLASNSSYEEQRAAALDATDPLRLALADALPFER